MLAVVAMGAAVVSANGPPVASDGYDPAGDPLVNPSFLSTPPPGDRSLIDTNATLRRRVQADPTTLNPILMYTAVDAAVAELLWDRPFVLDVNMEWRTNPAMVERYQESPDRLGAELLLKPGLRWHDGTPFTAADVVFSWRQILDDRVPCRAARSGPDQLADCVAVDERTVRFVHRRALPTNRWNIDFPIIPRHVYAPGKDDDPTLSQNDDYVRANRHPVGNGPYRFVEWKTQQRVVLERWDDYPGSPANFRRIVFRVIPDHQTALLAFEAGDIDEMGLTPQQFARETSGERFASVGVKAWGPQWTTYYIGWNCADDHPFFADRRVRVAMGHALDLARLRRQVFQNLYRVSRGPYPKGSWAHASDVTLYPFDLGRCAALLDEAGWRPDPDDGWRYREINGARARFSFNLHLIQGSATSPKVAAILQEDLRRVGVELKTRVLEWRTFNELNHKHEFDAYLSAWTAGPEPDEGWNLWHSTSRDGGRNYVSYHNPRVDALFEEGRQVLERAAREGIYREISRRVYRDAPYTFLVDAPTLWALNRGLRGVVCSPRGVQYFYPGVRHWWMPIGAR